MTEPAKDEARRAAEGRAWNTPFLAIGGVALVVAAAVVVLLGIAFTLWLLL